ncbi:MAG: ligase-associated DNA damage response endonuclease PdeM [Sinobacteraceae bacterium]|nr:ligase-associated DNA damage response endonuclease PdeM [Nevskiaceae bacterium]
MDGTLELILREERVMLHPARALLWPARATLIVADTHFGKDDVFRRAGIPLPRGPAITDLQRLSGLIRSYRCQRLIILGDFVHGATQSGDDFLHAFALWRRAHAQLTLEVIAGNHDRRENPQHWQGYIRWHRTEVSEPPFVLAHHPADSAAGYVLAGHVHPVLRMQRRHGGARVPVFWRRPGHLVLPSFGSLTGGMNISPAPHDSVYLAAPEAVMSFRDDGR